MSNAARLAQLEIGHQEAEQALVDLKARWEAEDELVRARRRFILDAHAQGARDRDAVRVRLGGMSLFSTSNEAEKMDTDPDDKQAAAEAWEP